MNDRPPPRRQEIVLIVIMVGALVAILTMQSRCARGIDVLFRGFDVPRARDGG